MIIPAIPTLLWCYILTKYIPIKYKKTYVSSPIISA